MYSNVKIFTAQRRYKGYCKAVDFVLKPPEKLENFIKDYEMCINIREGNHKAFFYLDAAEINRLINVLTQFTKESENTLAITRKCQTCQWIKQQEQKNQIFD